MLATPRLVALVSAATVLVAVVVARAQQAPEEWHRDMGQRTIYEVNIRQFSPEGTFNAFVREIPRLADMGVGVLWLMPIHPIGQVHRKGTLGSYYAPSDHTAVNPEFGNEEDFRALVDAAHRAGMLVIIDWVANHAAWDHVWTKTHPNRFTKGVDGGFTPPNKDWADVVDLNFDEPDTRRAMTDAMLHWVRRFDVDGFRCDVAELVPADFWRTAIAELRRVKPVFMLAEGEKNWLYEAGFDATYGWGLADTILKVRAGEADASAVRAYLEQDRAHLPPGRQSTRMFFTTNHDWNSWVGTAVERFGPAWEAATVLTFAAPGLPMIYSGQENGQEHKLAFFDKDLIRWRADPAADLYRALARAKRTLPALRHGPSAGTIAFLRAGDPGRLLVFRREAEGSEVIVFANLSGGDVDVEDVLKDDGSAALNGQTWRDLDGRPTTVPTRLRPWEARLLVHP